MELGRLQKQNDRANSPAKRASWPSGRLWLVVLLTLLAGSLLELTALRRLRAERELARQKRRAIAAVRSVVARRPTYWEATLPARATLTNFLEANGLSQRAAQAVVQAARPVYNLAHVRAGHRVTLIRWGGKLQAIHYQIDALRTLCVTRQAQGFAAHIQKIHYQDRVASVAGIVRGSLFQTIQAEGESPRLAVKIANIFSWNIDFNTESRPGDRFAALVNKRYLNGHFEGYGRLLAAEYDTAHHDYQAILFHTSSGRPAYYQPNGKSMQKAFLRSPLKFAARITSGFSYHRFHPILRRYLPHLGIDYAAPVGSPVQAVGSGTVLYAGWKGLDGKLVVLRHAHGYETYYMHLSRILVHRGQRVTEGQTIALSGDTGLSTGPHLDFRIEHDGVFRNFLTLNLPPAQSVSRRDWNQFARVRARVLTELQRIEPNPAPAAERASLLGTSVEPSIPAPSPALQPF